MTKIKVYSTTTCPYCKMLKSYLQEKNIQYEDVLLDQQTDKQTEFLDTCGSMSVPCTHITKDDGKEAVIVGYNKEALDKELGL